MKRLILGMLIALTLMLPWEWTIPTGIAQAEEVTPPATQYGLLSLNGATFYLPTKNILAVGPSIELARYRRIVTLNADAATALVKENQERTVGEKIDMDNFLGGSVGIDIAKTIEALGGTWIADALNPSLRAGVMANVTDIEDIEIAPSVSLNFINYSFSTP